MRYFSGIIGAVAAVVLGLAAAAGAQSFKEKAQVTIGGAEYMISGWVTKVEDDAVWIQQASGEETRVAINEGTHMLCKTRSEGSLKAEQKSGMGFRIGDCPFARGDVVKAEISDLGWASLIRYLEQPPPEKTADLGMPQDYGALAVPQGKLTFTSASPGLLVRTLDGKVIGPMTGTIVDTSLGMAYGIVVRSEDRYAYPIPWHKLKEHSPGPGAKPVLVLQETSEWLYKMHPPVYDVNRIDTAALRKFWEKAKPPLPVEKGEFDVEVKIKDKMFHITKGGSEKGFELLAGTESAIRLSNEDTITHEFVSSLFREVPFRLSGNATLVTTPRGSGVRLDPGQTIVLRFTVPVKDNFEPQYDLFWCNVHGKDHGAKMRGEALIVETRGDITLG